VNIKGEASASSFLFENSAGMGDYMGGNFFATMVA
jgi:hypothetical protein